MDNPILSVELSGQRKILLSWTFGSNADFQVFWKSSSPPGQEYALLVTTNAFTYTTADLDPSKTYSFYVRANVGAAFFYSNVVELFVSCGKGVVLSSTPPSPPPAQIKFDVIACGGLGATGDIWKLSFGGTMFAQTDQPAKYWTGLGVDVTNGDVYASSHMEGIYKQPGGVGAFTLFQAEETQWRQIVCCPNGDMYAASQYTGNYGVWKKAAGASLFTRYWTGNNFLVGMAAAPNGDVYTCCGSGDIYQQASGETSFTALGLEAHNWTGMCAAPNGDIYAATYNWKIWKRTGGVGDFAELSTPDAAWTGMAAAANGDIFACRTTVGIYKQSRGIGDFNLIFPYDYDWWGIAVIPK